MSNNVKIYLVFILLPISIYTHDGEKLANSALKCQFGKSVRKQIDVWPLKNMCMRDIVIHLSKYLQTLSNDELGVTAFQESLDKLDFVNSLATPSIKLKNLVSKINLKLKSYTDFIQSSYSIIQQVLLTQEDNIYANDKNVDTNQGSTICMKIINIFTINYDTQNWKNLHILPVSHPGTLCGPPSLAHNIGPLLISQCNKSKKVILLLEHSSFMNEEDVALAQVTAKTIVHMLSDTDYVSVIGLAVNGSVHCHNQILSRATDIHKIRLDRHIDSLTRIEKNESFFRWDVKSFLKDLNDEVVLIHLTNTLDNVSEMTHTVKEVESKNLTIHFGTIVMASSHKIKVNMKEAHKDGTTIIILPTQHVLGYEIAKLFTGLKCNNKDVKSYYLSDPYFEPYSKVMMLSIGSITNTALLSYNVKLREFVEDITYFNAGEHVHAVLMNRHGMVWMHKNFPRMETIVEQPLKVYFHDIENFNETELLKTGIMEIKDGKAELETVLKVKKQIFWQHLEYDDLIVCLIIEKEEESLPIVKNPPNLPSNILHHRLDLVLQTNLGRNVLCSYSNNRIGSLEAGVVYLSPWCFQSPSEHAKQLDIAPAVTMQSYMAYIKDTTRLLVNPGLQPSVKSDVATLAPILKHFKKRHVESSLSKYIIQRYVTSVTSGVLEIYPGVVLDSELDPKRRSWYTKALENPGKIILTTPYLDASGVGYVVTLSHTAYEGRPAALHSNKDPVVAVLAMDLTVGYLERMLFEMFTFCKDKNVKCFLMDDKGYLIYHSKLLDTGAKLENEHLMTVEYLVANDILNHEFFVKKVACASHMEGTTQRFYKFNTSLDEVLTNIVHGEHCVMYQLATIPGTNAFLGVINITCNISSFCPCSTTTRQCFNCFRMEQTDCECPCECSMFPKECNQKAREALDQEIEVCPAPTEQGSSQAAPWVRPGVLSSCQAFTCRSHSTREECLGIVGCQWCEVDSDGITKLPNSFCSDLSLCFGGILGAVIPYGDGAYNLQSAEELLEEEWSTFGPITCVIMGLVLIFGLSVFVYRLRNVPTGLEHQCLHMHNSPDGMRMTQLDGDVEPVDFEQEPKSTMDSSLLRDVLAPISPYRVFTNYRRPAGGDSDHGYSTMTPHEDSEQHTYVEPLLVLAGEVMQDLEPAPSTSTMIDSGPLQVTHLETAANQVLVPVTVHRNMDTHYC